MSLFQLGKRILGKKLEEFKPDAPALPRVDTGLPLGLRVGALLSVPRAAFAVLEGSLLRVPAESQMTVEAISRIRLDVDADLRLVRAYTACGARREGDGESFLQVLARGEDILEVAYYQFLSRTIPQTPEEQEPFLGKGYGLGERNYTMAADQLEAAGLSPEGIASLLAGEEALSFDRDAAGGEYVAPYTGKETRIDDPYGEKGLSQRIHFMPYVRTLPDGNPERLLISFEAQDSFDGTRKARVHVDFMVGLTLSPEQLKLI